MQVSSGTEDEKIIFNPDKQIKIKVESNLGNCNDIKNNVIEYFPEHGQNYINYIVTGCEAESDEKKFNVYSDGPSKLVVPSCENISINSPSSKLLNTKLKEEVTYFKDITERKPNELVPVTTKIYEVCGDLKPEIGKVSEDDKSYISIKDEIIKCEYLNKELLDYDYFNQDVKESIVSGHNEVKSLELNKDVLIQHSESKNKNDKGFKCDICSFETTYKKYLTQHVKNNHAQEKFKCSECSYESKQKRYLKQHVMIKHNESHERFKCTYCNHTTSYKGQLTRHIKVTHDKNFEAFRCTDCDYTTNRRTSLNQHISAKHGEGKEAFRCDQCDFRSGYKRSLTLHYKMQHNKDLEKLKCNRCSFETKWKAQLTEHMWLSHSENNETLKYANYDYLSKLKQDKSITVLKCDECDYTTNWEKSLKRHKTIKHDQITKKFKCNECYYKAVRKCFLIKHLIMHHGNNEVFKCEKCNFTTKSKRNLLAHIKTFHSDCSEMYVENISKNKIQSSLHLTVEEDRSSKVFRCDSCEYTTKYKHNFRKHSFTKHKGRAPVMHSSD